MKAMEAKKLPSAPNLPDRNFRFRIFQGDDRFNWKLDNRLNDLKGHNVVMVFWGSSCPSCKSYLPILQLFYEAHDDVLVLGIDVGNFLGLGTREEAKAMSVERGYVFPMAYIFQQDMIKTYKIVGIPTTYFLNKDGQTEKRFVGAKALQTLNAMLEEVEDIQ